ncbi:patatin-like phospholipase family protein [Sphingomonas sp. AR_OL41]|uniref:patatin-like phospholipase family protein n=1 Tax=Sphingomonas sp. AR_OL41 TaxID=3042729 RepID=UPI0024816647|nr:patatin-like phospholipase family protein [Sphingomonas sp. AR_OL41]MDH7971891.1 patatin-like phospholipase family protein [Sphingomonas sp. AR_OL41]
MADIDHPHHGRKGRKAAALPLPDCVALVLQGGGALGSYQAGVIEGLAASGIEIDWVAGISIGAVNAAIVAGNPPERRVERLATFWETLSSSLPSFPIFPNDQLREWLHEWSAGFVMAAGVPGFFTPRVVPPLIAMPGSPGALSFYDSAPLAKTLDALVDWDLLNNGPVRLSVGAVDVESGNFSYFDTTETRIDARHIMASGALPPGLPPIEIDGRLWWDGGLVSNTPLTHVLDNQTEPLLAFQVDLFAAATERPKTIMDVMAREKEIRFSSRTRQISAQVMKLRQEREAIRKVLAKLPPALQDDADVRALAARAAEQPVNLVQLIYRANAWEGGSRDFEFSARTMREHWAAGRLAVDESMANAELVANNIETGHSASFDLVRRPQPLVTE